MGNLSHKFWLRSPSLSAVVSLSVAYVIAYVIDISLQQLESYTRTTFDFSPAFIFSSVTPGIVVMGILALAWFALRCLPPSWFVGIAFLVSGLFVIGVNLSYFVDFPLWLRATIVGQFRYTMMSFGLQSSIYYVASACVIIGVAVLRRRTVKDRASISDGICSE